MLFWKDGMICLSFQIEPVRRGWLKKHEDKLREAVSQVVAISTNDFSQRTWEIDSAKPIWLEFPEEYPDRFRIGLIASETSIKKVDSTPLKLWKESINLALRRNSAKK